MFNLSLSFSLLFLFSTSAIACSAYDRKTWKHWIDADRAEIAALQVILGTEVEMSMLAEECAGTMTSEEMPASQVDCQAKRYCTQMKTCEEAWA